MKAVFSHPRTLTWVVLLALGCSSGSVPREAAEATLETPASTPGAASSSPSVAPQPPSAAGAPSVVASVEPGDDFLPVRPSPSALICDGVTLEVEDADEDGNFVLEGVVPFMSNASSHCPATDPAASAGGLVVATFQAPRDGEYTAVTSSPSVTMLSVQNACETGRFTTSTCAVLPYYLDPRFAEAERRVTFSATEGEAFAVVADSSTGEPIDLYVITPALEGQPCGLLSNPPVERTCAELACDGSLQVCGRGSPPSIESALAFSGEDRLSLRLETSDPDSDVDVGFVRVRLLDADGAELEVIESQDGLPRKSDRWVTTESEATPGVLRAELRVAADTLARSERCAVAIADEQGQPSPELELELSARVERSAGEACDGWGASDACSPGHVCMTNTEGELTCSPYTLNIVLEGPTPHVDVRVPDAAPQAEGVFDFYVSSASLADLSVDPKRVRLGDDYVYWASTRNGPPARVPRGPAPSGWQRQHRLDPADFLLRLGDDVVPDELLVRFEPPSNGGPTVLALAQAPERSLGEACDGARTMDRCEAGTACLVEEEGEPFTCRVPSPPELVSVRWFDAEGVWGFIVEGRDPDGDVESAVLEAVEPDGSVVETEVREIGDARGFVQFTSGVWFGHAVGESLQLRLVDREGLASDPVSQTMVDTGPVVGALGSPCDVNEVAVQCEEGAVCTSSDYPPWGMRCRDAAAECPEDWGAQDLELPAAPPLLLEGTTKNAPGFGNIANWSGDHTVAYRLEAKVRGVYDVWAVGVETDHVFEVRTSCPLSSTKVLPGTRYDEPNESSNGSGVDLEAGDVVYVLVADPYYGGGAFELFVTWTEL